MVVLGFLLGLTRLPFTARDRSQRIYVDFLLFLVGIQLRNNGMSLRQIVLNRRGMIVAVVVTASSLLGGILNAFILGLPLKTGLAMASGFGWYSLSGILLTESFGPVIGSAAFFNDLCRELLAIMLIPALFAAAAPRRWGCAAPPRWTSPYRYCSVPAASKSSLPPSCTVFCLVCWSRS
nr:Membrane protein of uncharacterised function (DUF340) [Klebsiella pneumoniae]